MTNLDEGQRIKLPGEERYVVIESVTVSDGGLKLIVDDGGDLRKAALSPDEAAVLETLTEDGGAEPSGVLAGLWVEWMRRASEQASATALATNPLRPYPHQNRAVYGAMLPQPLLRFLLADEPGTGKTIMGGLWLREMQRLGFVRRALVVCPAHLVTKWQGDFELFLGGGLRRITADTIREEALSGEHDLWVVSLELAAVNRAVYDAIHPDQAGWDAIVFDEAHRLTPTAEQYHGVGRMLAVNTPRAVLMTATPHRGNEWLFRSLMHLVDPEVYPAVDRLDGEQPAQHLKPGPIHFLRRMKEELVDYDGVTRLFLERIAYNVVVPLNVDERAFYNEALDLVDRFFPAAAQGLAKMVYGKRAASALYSLAETLRRRRDGMGGNPADAARDADPFGDDEAERDLAEVVAEASTSSREEKKAIGDLLARIDAVLFDESYVPSKWPSLLKCVEPHGIASDGSEQLVVFTEFADTADWLVQRFKAAGFNAQRYSGRDPHHIRDQIRAKFAAGDFQVIVSTDAGNEGIDLQTAHVLVNWDIPWSLVRLEQRMGRIHRIGQTNVVELYNLIATGTREGDAHARLLENLCAAANELNGKMFDSLSLVGEIALAESGINDLEKLLARTYETDDGSLLAVRAVRAITKERLRQIHFQQRFVWRPADIDLLLTSLVQDFPAGSLLFLRAGAAEQELAWRSVEGVDGDGSVSPDYLVLDGQQRLTSLSLALNGRGEHLFFMDLKLLEEGDYENGIYPLRRSKAKQRGLLEKETQWSTHTYPISAALGEGQDEFWFEDYIEYQVAQGADREETKERARRLRQEFVKPLREYAFPAVELPAETSLEAVCQIFETLNKTGMKLTVFDLLTAKFWPQGLNLRARLEQARSDYPLLGEDGFDVEATYLLQAMALLRMGLCKRGDLLQLKRERFEEDWDRVCAAASAALAMLRGECGVLVRNWLPYAALFPALFAAATKVEQMHGPEAGAGWEKLKRWFWCSCLGQRYDGPPNTLNAQDVRQLTAWLEDDEAVPEAVAEFKLSDVNLRRTDRQRAALYRAVICTTIVNGARDFHNGQRLTPDLLSDPNRRIEDHHLNPTGWLKKRTPPRDAENTILNRCLIDHVTNKLIGDKAPSKYLAEIEAKLGADKVEAILESHLIPSTGAGALTNDDVDAFLAARERMLIEAMAAVTGAPLHELSDGEVYLDPSRPFTNELALLGVIRGLHGNVFWYEQHMGRKVLEPLAEELDRERVREIQLLSGPANVDEKTKRAFERFAEEMANSGINCEWRVLPAELARDLHARVLFDSSSVWELPPLNSLLKGAVDSIRASKIPRESFERAWNFGEALPITEYRPTETAKRP